MADDDAALEPEQRRAAVLGVVDPRLKRRNADFERRNPTEAWSVRLISSRSEFSIISRESLRDLQDHVAGEAVGHDDVHVPVEDVAALDVADEVQAGLLQDLEGLLRAVRALGVLLADRHEPDPGLFDPEERARRRSCPMTANSRKCWFLRPGSRRRPGAGSGRKRSGRSPRAPGRSTPSIVPITILAETMAAPVCPAETSPSARPRARSWPRRGSRSCASAGSAPWPRRPSR